MKKLGKQNIALLIGIVGLLAIMVGSSYAIFTNEVESTKTQIVEVGKAKVVLTEPASGLNLTNVESMGEYEGISQGTYYDFSIENTGDISANYKIKLIDNTAALATYNGEVLSEEYLRIGIESNRLDTTVKNINTVDRIIDEDVIYENETINYRMRIWVDFNMLTQEEIQNLSEASIFLKLKIEIEQTLYDINPETFTYTGNYQEYTVPETGYYNIELWGAQGGGGSSSGGKGTYTKGIILLTKGEKIYFYAGGAGGIPTICPVQTVVGWNGGFINANCRNDPSSIHGNLQTLVSGGATDIRLVSGTWDNITSLRSRIMVAAGGGAGIGGCIGAAGGGLLGNSGCKGIPLANENLDVVGKGGTQTSGGATGSESDRYDIWFDMEPGGFGYGGRGTLAYEQGGSSGYYGGGGASVATGNVGNGGTGSSYISGYAGVNSITSASSSVHTNTTKHYSGKYFINGKMADGVNSGNGMARITYLGTNVLTKTNTKLNNVRYIKSCLNGSSFNDGNFWIEIQAIKDGVNLAKGKPVTGTVVEANNTTRSYVNIVDGKIDNINGSEGYGQSYNSGLQCVTVDLGSIQNLDEVVAWNYYDGRTFYDNTLSVGVTNVSGTTSLSTILHNYPGSIGYLETSQGKRYTAWD